MCGRFALISTTEQLTQHFNLNSSNTIGMPPSVPRYNIAPSQPVAAVRLNQYKQRELTFFRWGLIPSWAKDMKMSQINARSETVAEKPFFRAAFKRRRCIIPVNGFYEWQRTKSGKQPMYIYAADKKILTFAGLWEIWNSPNGDVLQSCTILTTSPNEMMAQIHNRMPVILEPEDYDAWLDPKDQPNQAKHLFRSYPSTKMAAHPVSTFVNSPRNEAAQCIAPLH